MDAYFINGVSATTLHDLLQSGAGATWEWLYAETQLEMTLCHLSDAVAEEIGESCWQNYALARVFGEQCELAWWRQADGRYQVRLLLEQESLPSGMEWGNAEAWQAWGQPTSTLLHGTIDLDRSLVTGEASWSEARIPRYLLYPIDVDLSAVKETETVRVVLNTQAYALDGIVGLTRLIHLQTVTLEAADV